MAISPEELAELRALIRSDGRNTERECQQFLHHATALMMRATPVGDAILDQERRSYWGDSDYIFGATLRTDADREEQFVSVWELKAPQCFIMERDENDRRFRPTRDLFKAENQLLHYAYEAERNGVLHEHFGIAKKDNVKIGGIVIGRSDTWVNSADPEIVKRAKNSFDVRSAYFYRSMGIRVMTWDHVLAFLEPPNPGHQ